MGQAQGIIGGKGEDLTKYYSYGENRKNQKKTGASEWNRTTVLVFYVIAHGCQQSQMLAHTDMS
jgi:hypothetical protein